MDEGSGPIKRKIAYHIQLGMVHMYCNTFKPHKFMTQS